jgi:SulP family sulfate permease
MVGYPEGVATGIVAAVVLFVHNYSRVNVVSHALSGADLRSNVDRPVRAQRRLREVGEQIYVLRLQGFIFFGTANHLLHEVRDRAADARRQGLRFAIMDFRRVSGLDSSAVFSLWKAHQLARRLGFTLIMTQVNPEIARQLALGGLEPAELPSFRMFPDLDHALEWCENLLLTAELNGTNGHDSHLSEQLKELWPQEVSADRLLPYLQREEVAPGTHVIRQAELSESLYFIESGLVTARMEFEDGRALRLRTMGAGTVVGEVGLFLGGKRTASVVAEKPCTIYRLSSDSLQRMRRDDPELALAFHRFVVCLLAERLTSTSNMLRGLTE